MWANMWKIAYDFLLFTAFCFSRKLFSVEAESEAADIFEYVNPVTVGIELLLKLHECYPDYASMVEQPNEIERICAEEMYKKLHIIKTDYEYVEADEVDDDCDGELVYMIL